VEASIAKLLPTMPRQEVIRTSLGDRGALIKVRDMDEACAIANSIAAEHLEISADPQQWADKIRHAGAMFLGRFSSESLGDYCCGPNHVLPTSRTARFSSPLGVYDFQKRSVLITSAKPARRRWARSPPNWPTAKACRRTPAARRAAPEMTMTASGSIRSSARMRWPGWRASRMVPST
jgi:histidinol dehydrogenase